MEYKIRSAVLPVLIANVVFFIIQMTSPIFTEMFILRQGDAFTRPWTILTSMFLHSTSTFNHIFFNMYFLLLFGPLLEQKIGVKRFLMLYFGAGVVAGLLASFFYPRALGASGALMGIIGTLIILMPDLQMLFFFVVPMPLWFLGIIYIAIDAFGILFPSGTGNIAHLAGMGVGLLYGLYLKKESQRFHKKFTRKKHLDEFDMEEYLRSGRI